jgi:amidophosphoribosyltransferase
MTFFALRKTIMSKLLNDDLSTETFNPLFDHTEDGGSTINLDDDKLHEECGIFGIFRHNDAPALTALGLHALQHRGQEAAGIVSFNGKVFKSQKRHGLVGDYFRFSVVR